MHALIDEKRHSWARVQLFATADDRAGAEPHAQVDERTSLVAALRELPPRQRAVLVMRFLLDRPIEEVAEALNCSVGTVKSQSSRSPSHPAGPTCTARSRWAGGRPGTA